MPVYHSCAATAGSCRATRQAAAVTAVVMCRDDDPWSAPAQNGAVAVAATGRAKGMPPSGRVIDASQSQSSAAGGRPSVHLPEDLEGVEGAARLALGEAGRAQAPAVAAVSVVVRLHGAEGSVPRTPSSRTSARRRSSTGVADERSSSPQPRRRQGQ